MCCKGKCHLNKKLKQQESKSNENPFQSIKENFDLTFFFTKNDFDFNIVPSQNLLKFKYVESISNNYKTVLFRPPSIFI